MEHALSTHKETTFGWVLMIQEWSAALKALAARRGAVEAAQAARRPMRFLAPR